MTTGPRSSRAPACGKVYCVLFASFELAHPLIPSALVVQEPGITGVVYCSDFKLATSLAPGALRVADRGRKLGGCGPASSMARYNACTLPQHDFVGHRFATEEVRYVQRDCFGFRPRRGSPEGDRRAPRNRPRRQGPLVRQAQSEPRSGAASSRRAGVDEPRVRGHRCHSQLVTRHYPGRWH